MPLGAAISIISSVVFEFAGCEFAPARACIMQRDVMTDLFSPELSVGRSSPITPVGNNLLDWKAQVLAEIIYSPR